MNTAVLTAYNEAMAPIGDLTSPLMEAYARKHDFEFFCSRVIAPEMHYWQKITWTCALLESGLFERVIWFDSDIVVTNPEFDPPWFTGFQASLDWGSDAIDESCFSMCCYVVGVDMLDLFQDIRNAHHQFADEPFPEQTAARHFYRRGGDYKYRMRTHSRRTFNAVPNQIEGATDVWQPGDWVCHITHVSCVDRVRIFHEIMRENSK